MSSRKRSKPKGRARRAARPILWIGGAGLPGGATGRKLVALGHPLHWEPDSRTASRTVASLAPALVVVETEKLDRAHRTLFGHLAELKTKIDLVVFQLRRSPARAKPANVDGVLVRGPSLAQQVKVVLQTMEGARIFKQSGVKARKQLDESVQELERLRTLAVRDDLTSLYNLRFFNRSLETEHQRATRFGRSYTLVFLDLDGLRELNARRGHLAGGQALKQVGDFLASRIRQIDLPARIGGDEFVIICPETTKDAATMVAERLRHGIQRLTDEQGKSLGITVSIGIASFPDDADLPEDVLQRADRALYQAKAQGKNRVCRWGDFDADKEEKSFLGSVHTLSKLV